MKKRFLSLLCVLALCLGLLPITALAEEDAPDKLYVGNCQITDSNNITYLKADSTSEGSLTQGSETDWTVKYEPGTATLTLKDATIKTTHTSVQNAVIYAESSQNSAVSLTIVLQGNNTIGDSSTSYGIYVNAEANENTYGSDASLTISGENDGSLEVSGSQHGIYVKSGSGNASLTIENASVDAKTTNNNSSYAGVYVLSSVKATVSPQLSLTVKGGSLTASGGTSSDGILFYVGSPDATATTSLTVSGNAIVDAKTGGISATQDMSPIDTTISSSTTDTNGGIVFDGTEGTVYGEVTLQDELTIGSGETLTIGKDASLTVPEETVLTNNGTILVESGGTLSGGTALTTPTINTHPQAQEVTAGETAEFSVTASNAQTYQWQQSTDNGSSWEDINGAASETYTTAATTTDMNHYQYRCMVTADGGVSVISNAATLTVNAKPAPPAPTYYTITAEASPAEGGVVTVNGNTSATVTAGSTVALTATPNSGYRFVGWVDQSGQSVSSNNPYTFAATSDSTLTAKFEKVVYTITVRASGSGTVTGGGTYAEGETVTLTATPNSGYRFVRWEENGTVASTSATYTFAASRDCALTAVFARNSGGGSSGGSSSGGGTPTYSVSLPDRVTGGAVAVSPRNARKGTTVTLTATPDEGCELASLTVTDSKGNEIDLTDEGNGEYTFTMPASKVTIAAVFAEIETLPAPLPFADVAETAWYADAVRYAYENGLMNGTSAAAFDPDGTMDRAMLVTILYRQAGEPAVNYAMPFDDVAAGQWYSEAVRWAAGGGVVTGTGDTTFEPDAPVTREQFAVILYRYAQQSGADVSVGEDTNILSYTDAMDISEYAVPAMQWACGAGVMQGSGGSLSPQGQATRAEAAAMLMRYLQR